MTPRNPEPRSTTARIGLGILLGLSLFAVVAAPLAAADVHVDVSGCGEPLDGHEDIPAPGGPTYVLLRCE